MKTSVALAEGERERFDAGIEKLNLERPILDGTPLANQLIQAVAGPQPGAVGIDVPTPVVERRSAVEEHPKSNGTAARSRPQHQVQIPGMESETNRAR